MEQILKESEKVHKVQTNYIYQALDKYKMAKIIINDPEFKEFKAFKEKDLILGDCITSSFHILEILCSEGFEPSYVEGKFIEINSKKEKKEIYHVVPCVVHHYQNKEVLLSLLDFSRYYFITLMPGKSFYNPKNQEFVWGNGFLYQILKEDVERKVETSKIEKKPQDICVSLFEIKKYDKKLFLEKFSKIVLEDLKNYRDWDDYSYCYKNLNITKSIKIQELHDDQKKVIQTLKNCAEDNLEKKCIDDPLLFKFVQNKNQLFEEYFQEISKEIEYLSQDYINLIEDLKKLK